ncbi:metal-dependent hydrolase [Zymobacter palmae]|uniref:Membrane-bound metal-dependent hydrolase n=1 Tax=Zymobacter palmae TaxID=33074 RepID=A0A348HIB8_9GAMM|nr:metal-dependent hydrolase [Zymobacter palmae]BBG31370.1 hypothetical protein ZBT109_2645 [Zymobacter palmae]
MANFRTHLAVASLAGGCFAIAGYHASALNLSDAISVAGLMALGGIMPDIDADRSHTVRLVFTVLAVGAVIMTVISALPLVTTPGLILLALLSFLGTRYVASAFFRRLTVHRGIWHSLLAGLTVGVVITAASVHLFGSSAWLGWLQGCAMLVGYVIHLLLDEIWSIDASGLRLKKSFGTALKPLDIHAPQTALPMVAAIVICHPWLPPLDALWGVWHTVQGVWRHLL